MDKNINSFDYVAELLNDMINKLLDKNIPLSLIVVLIRQSCSNLIKENFNEKDKKILSSVSRYRCNNKLFNIKNNTNVNTNVNKEKINEKLIPNENKTEIKLEFGSDEILKNELKPKIIIKIKNKYDVLSQ